MIIKKENLITTINFIKFSLQKYELSVNYNIDNDKKCQIKKNSNF